MNGGIVFAGQLLPRLNFLLQVEYCHPSRYGHQTQGAELVWKVLPPEEIKGREVLILDDIYDEGRTLAGIVEKCQNL
jgi:hypoxanthine phosphoribosyltransferase